MAPIADVCAGCRKEIVESKKYLQCCACRQVYDLLCANITAKQFNSKSLEYKQKWTCMECKCKQPKTDNLNTPIRAGRAEIECEHYAEMGLEEENAAFLGCVNMEDHQNKSYTNNPNNDVITRRQLSHQNQYYKSNSPEMSLLENIRVSIREELEQTLHERLPIIISKFVSEQVAEVVNNTITKLNDRIKQLEKKLELLETNQNSETKLPKMMTNSNTDILPQSEKKYGNRKPSNEHSEPQEYEGNNPDDLIQHSGWIGVHKKQKNKIIKGSASPGATQIEACERWRYLHLYYVKVGTSEDQVKTHLKLISGSDDCMVESLNARGNYASYKLSVPDKLADSVMDPKYWPKNICIKQWRQNFRNKTFREPKAAQ